MEGWESSVLWIAVDARGDILATARETGVGERGIRVVESVWVRGDERGSKLGLQVIQALLDGSESPVLWLDCRPSLVPYYAALGFEEDDKAEITPDYMDEEDPPDQAVMSLRRPVRNLDAPGGRDGQAPTCLVQDLSV